MAYRLAGRRGLAIAGLLLGSLVSPRAGQAQPRTWVGSLSYESPGLLAPVLFVVSTDDDGREWSAGLIGWTLAADWKGPAGARRRHVFVRVTPVNANASNVAYRQGLRDERAEYRPAPPRGAWGPKSRTRVDGSAAIACLACTNGSADGRVRRAGVLAPAIRRHRDHTAVHARDVGRGFGARWEA